MKKLKKGLSLLLVLAMVFSLASTAFAWETEYTDDAEITQKEAVAVMTGMGIINGTGTGDFDPTGTFTREQAAKIVTYMILGADTAEALDVAPSSFTDVSDGWSAPYIAYAQAQGIIAGYGNGKFGPQDELTKSAWLKILLVSLGVDAKKNGLVNDNQWAANAQALAVRTGLITSAELKMEFNRETAVLYAFEAMQLAQKGVTSLDTTTTVNDTTDTGGKIRAYVPVLKSTTTEDEFGREYTTWYNGETGKNKVDYASGANELVVSYENETVKVDDLLKALDLTTSDVNSISNDVVKVQIVIDGEPAATLNTNTHGTIGGKGSTVEVYKHNKGEGETAEYRVVVINTYVAVVGKIAKDAKTVELASGVTASVDGLTKGDIVSYNEGATDKGINAYNVTKLEATEITVTATGTVNPGSVAYVRVNGEKVFASENIDLNESTTSLESIADIARATVYLDTYGNILYVKETSISTRSFDGYYYVQRGDIKAASDSTITGGSVQAKARVVDLTTGTVSVIDRALTTEADGVYLADENGDKSGSAISSDSDDDLTAGFYGYYAMDDGTYVLESVDDITPSAKDNKVVETGKATVYGVSGAYADANTKLTYLTVKGAGYEVSTVTGIADFPTLLATDDGATPSANVVTRVYAVTDAVKTNKITEIYVIGADVKGATVAKTYGVFKEDGEHDIVNNTYSYVFVVDGKDVTYTGTSSKVTYASNTVYEITLNAKGEITTDAATSVTKVAKGTNELKASVVESSYLVYNKDGEKSVLYFADDAQVYDTTSDKCGLVEGAEISIYTAVNSKTDEPEIIYVVVTKAPDED